jgi:hypothetical protein
MELPLRLSRPPCEAPQRTFVVLQFCVNKGEGEGDLTNAVEENNAPSISKSITSIANDGTELVM